MDFKLKVDDVQSITIKPGDCLLYKSTSLFGLLIGFKTWHDVSHCEAYVGQGFSVASRDGKGVEKYPIRTDGLIHVLRPTVPFDLDKAMRVFRMKYKGQKYDWMGLLRFAWRSKVVPDNKDNRQFCSEFLTRFYRAGGLDPFNGMDADCIPPCHFLLSDHFVEVMNHAELA